MKETKNHHIDAYLVFRWIDPPKEMSAVEGLEQESNLVRTDLKANCPIPGPSSDSSSPACSPARQSQHYRTLQIQSNSTTSRPTSINQNSSSYQRDFVDLVHGKRWHTAPKEKHKVKFYITYFFPSREEHTILLITNRVCPSSDWLIFSLQGDVIPWN